MKKRLSVIVLLFLVVPLVYAHANVLEQFPSVNSKLPLSPSEVRLWFTEPLEPAFSVIKLYDAKGNILDLPSVVDVQNPTQMVIYRPQLPDGLYTVDWRAVSATDGHSTHGSYAFTVGLKHQQDTIPILAQPDIPMDSTIARWLNLIGFASFVGVLGFQLFVWKPSMQAGHTVFGFETMIWIGWIFVGVTGLLMLLAQSALYSNAPLLDITRIDYGTVITKTRFGTLWLVRMGVWLALGVCLWLARRDTRIVYGVFVGALAMLITQSLFSHAVNAQDTLLAIVSDWLHLVSTVLWVGGLFSLAVTIPTLYRHHANPAAALSKVVAYFSNYSRIWVIVLVVTGVYASYLQVGSVPALLATPYGIALLIKWVLFIPLIGIAAINLLVTGRRLRRGDKIWVGRLRTLVLLEATFSIGILLAVGVMTSINPAKTQYDILLAQQRIQKPPFFEMQLQNGLMVHFEISPNTVGDNNFVVTLYDETGVQVTDASLIRIRVENQEAGLGKSELRPELQDDGTYKTSGTNLSLSGNWKVRMTIQRPQKFDTIVDYFVTVNEP